MNDAHWTKRRVASCRVVPEDQEARRSSQVYQVTGAIINISFYSDCLALAVHFSLSGQRRKIHGKLFVCICGKAGLDISWLKCCRWHHLPGLWWYVFMT
jgi:hypothetical protein